MEENKICACCEEPIEGDEFKTLGDESIVCNSCFEESCKKCEHCCEYYLEDDMKQTGENEYYCESCYEDCFAECDMCHEMVLEDDLEYFGDDMRICPECFAEEFPEIDEDANLEETTPAYEAMLKRLIGLKVEDMANEIYEYDSGMDDDGYRYSFTVDIDKDGHISDVSRLTKERCQAVWITGESWHACEIDSDDYAEDGLVEDTIRCMLDIADEDDDENDSEE